MALAWSPPTACERAKRWPASPSYVRAPACLTTRSPEPTGHPVPAARTRAGRADLAARGTSVVRRSSRRLPQRSVERSAERSVDPRARSTSWPDCPRSQRQGRQAREPQAEPGPGVQAAGREQGSDREPVRPRRVEAARADSARGSGSVRERVPVTREAAQEAQPSRAAEGAWPDRRTSRPRPRARRGARRACRAPPRPTAPEWRLRRLRSRARHASRAATRGGSTTPCGRRTSRS
jgi:hypothetical protein